MRFYRLLLLLYPASFRREYGAEMIADFARRRRKSSWALLDSVLDVLKNATAAHWDVLRQDLRYTVRSLKRSRGFAFAAVAVIAIGVGANTAAFSVADFVLFRPLSFPDPNALVRLCWGPRTGGGWGCMNQLSPANYRDYKNMTSSFQAMGAYVGNAVNLVGSGEPQRISGAQVTSDVLPLLGVSPLLGRVFEPTSDGATDARSVVLSYGLWQSQFGGDPRVLGRGVNLNGTPYEVIGVMPPDLYFPTRETKMWTLLLLRDENYTDRTARRASRATTPM